MEQHPVPQNVTTFQFRLIGDMTLKQFGYLAGGAIAAFISYKLPLPFFFRWPLTFIFAFGGFGFAFVPIEERPMDVWVLSFLKNVYNPTIFIWQRTAPTPETNAVPAAAPTKPAATPAKPAAPAAAAAVARPVTVPAPAAPQPAAGPRLATGAPKAVTATLQGLFTQAPQQAPVAPMPYPTNVKKSPIDAFFVFIDSLFTPKPKMAPVAARPYIPPPVRPAAAPAPVPSAIHMPAAPSVTGKHVEAPPIVPPPAAAARPAQQTPVSTATDTQLKAMQDELARLKATSGQQVAAEQRILDLQKQLTDMISQRESMERELAKLRTGVQPAAPAPTKTAGVVVPSPQKGPTVKVMGPEAAVRAGLPKLTSFPNVITGIIKDFENNLLPGILVTVRDKDGIPLRALKTNKLGQFAASTPLPNGTYVIEVEDPRDRFTFDRAQITLTGAVIPAVEIIAKSKRELDREKLTKEIFGQPNF